MSGIGYGGTLPAFLAVLWYIDMNSGVLGALCTKPETTSSEGRLPRCCGTAHVWLGVCMAAMTKYEEKHDGESC